jgi:hypothetical protein
MAEVFKRILKEPLLHFVVLGAAMFAAYTMLSKRGSDEPGRVIVTRGQIENLAAGFARTWQRPPSREELDGLIRDRVREEIYCREAIALGLDRDDTVIRRRLRQKMEFISEDIAPMAEPTDADLQAYLQAHPDKFRTEPRFTFQHVYLNPQKHGENLARDAARLLAQLQQAGGRVEISGIGDSSLLEPRFADAPQSEVAKQFGDGFAARLVQLTPGQWQGPIESAFGMHLVLVSERREGRLPGLAEARDAIRRDWENTRRVEANERFYQELLKRYTVTVETVEPTASQGALATSR